MTQFPDPPGTRQVGLREITLLLVAAGFALLMLDLGNLAVITGWVVVALWAFALVRGPKPTSTLTLVYGAGLFVTTFWWPEQGWWVEAIALMWVAIGMMLIGLAMKGIGQFRQGSAS